MMMSGAEESELRSCVNREVGLGPHSLSHSAPVPDKPYGFCGRRAPWKKRRKSKRPKSRRKLCERRGGRPGLPVPSSPYGLCGRKATLNCNISEPRSCVEEEVDVLGPSPREVAILCDMHSLMPVGFSHVFIYEWLFFYQDVYLLL